MAEDASSLLDEITTDSKRRVNCSVCAWLDGRDDAEEWDRVMALPWQQANAKAIWRAMVRRGFERGDKTVDEHRRKGHRVPA